MLAHELQGGVPQAPGRHVDDALELQVVRRIGDNLEIGDRVLDLGPLVEARTADDAIGQAERDEAVFEGAHLEARPHQDRRLVELVAAPLRLLDIVGDGARFLLVVPEPPDRDLLAEAHVGVQRLAEAAGIVGDEVGGGAENVTRRAVVLLEPDDLGAGKVFLEAQDVVDLRPAPAIDRLVVVADAANVARPLGQEPQPEILHDVGVLVFVDQDVAEAAVILRENVRVPLQDL